MPAWPAGFKILSTVDAYSFQPSDPVTRTEMESGPPKSRLRYTDATTRYSLAVPFSTAELKIFETWHKFTLKQGSLWFDMPLANGSGVTVCQAQFDGTWSARRGSGEKERPWLVSFGLIVRNRPVEVP